MKQNVAAYCRVSTDKGDQINSLENQKQYFHRYIEQNTDWNLTEIYVDEGITGTSTKKRHSFNQMLQDAGKHKFDLILTKEISRFARNTLDSIYYTRELRNLGIGVIFLNDSINTLDSDAELRLTILSSIAQEESRKTSERVKWGQRQRMEQGVVFGRDLLGYDVHEGKLILNEEGAEIVRRIYQKFTYEGKGTYIIAKELEQEGVPTLNHLKNWSNVIILRILKNEKYVGDLIQKKTYTPNYLNHEKKYNHGEEEFVNFKNHHEPIISRELYNRTQEELKRRSRLYGEKSKYSNRYCFSGKIKCSKCGSSYVSRTRKHRDGSMYREWRCYEAVKNGKKQGEQEGAMCKVTGCTSCSIKDADLQDLLKQVMKEIVLIRDNNVMNKNNPNTGNARDINADIIDGQRLLNHFMAVVKSVLEGDNNTDYKINDRTSIIKLKEKKKRLIELYLSNEISKEEFQSLNRKYEENIKNIEIKERNESMEKSTEKSEEESMEKSKEELKWGYNNIIIGKNSKLEDISCVIYNLITGGLWEDKFYNRMVDTIIIKDKVTMDIYLRSLPQKIMVRGEAEVMK